MVGLWYAYVISLCSNNSIPYIATHSTIVIQRIVGLGLGIGIVIVIGYTIYTNQEIEHNLRNTALSYIL